LGYKNEKAIFIFNGKKLNAFDSVKNEIISPDLS